MELTIYVRRILAKTPWAVDKKLKSQADYNTKGQKKEGKAKHTEHQQ